MAEVKILKHSVIISGKSFEDCKTEYDRICKGVRNDFGVESEANKLIFSDMTEKEDECIVVFQIPEYDTEMEFKRRCYELYQLDWMRTHGYSLQDAFNMLKEGYAECWESGNIDGGTSCDNDFNAMKEYFEEHGFGGEIFACENEFYDCEYKDIGYMECLLPKDMLEQYNSYQ